MQERGSSGSCKNPRSRVTNLRIEIVIILWCRLMPAARGATVASSVSSHLLHVSCILMAPHRFLSHKTGTLSPCCPKSYPKPVRFDLVVPSSLRCFGCSRGSGEKAVCPAILWLASWLVLKYWLSSYLEGENLGRLAMSTQRNTTSLSARHTSVGTSWRSLHWLVDHTRRSGARGGVTCVESLADRQMKD